MTVPPTAARRGEWTALLALGGPLAAVQVCQMAMTTATSAVLGHLGSVALAGGGLGAAINSALVLVAQGCVAGLQPFVAQSGSSVERGRILAGALCVALASSVPVTWLLLHVSTALAWLDIPPAVEAAAVQYCMASALGTPFAMSVATLRYFLVAVRRTGAVMAIAVAALACNAALSWALAYGKFGAPSLGVRGAGLASTFTWAAMLVSLAAYAVRVRLCPLPEKGWTWPVVAESARCVLRVGWPIAVGYASEIWLFLLFSTMVARYGPASLSVHQMTLNLVNMAFMVPLALSQATTVRVAHHWGAGHRQGAGRAAALALALGAAYAAACAVLLNVFPQTVVRVFIASSDPQYGRICEMTNALFVLATLYIGCDALQSIASGAMRGTKRTRVPMLIVVGGYWGLGLPAGWALSTVMTPAVAGLWTGIALGALCVAALMLALLWRSFESPSADGACTGAG